ncbi:TPA: phage baseplate assembly protein [Klebsiella pneumoniae]|uniref:phage baseplate assembly protein n=1 Tax=Klebsiella pneumoniae TaxID=573 RepID=UPI00164648CE|nr:contractile injection system protein, VgrG/Pvc8 family [Klebsiella pneumoniae]EKW2891650.1 phage tail protein [Klebsiella pneumoniae]ELA0627909.1 phage tail protein [Klebsiella pneumoniae]MBC4125385.1 phage tail protein [Klebsiella pneumoniae]MBX4703678.1 phage tail protein [Klebsiella pneumoniae]MCD9656145.1 phage tail protein [Klebsiella pneumoniae]
MSDVELKVNSRAYTGWLNVEITRSIEQLSGQFTLGLALPVTSSAPDVVRGQAVEVSINNTRVITGWVMATNPEIGSDNFDFNVTGRDKTCDLVDCSAVWQAGQWLNQPLRKIAADLCQPFGVEVVWSVRDALAAKPFATFKLDHGETVHDALSRAARQRGVIITSDALGRVVFTEPGTDRADDLILGQNLLQCKNGEDDSDRFSLYRVLGDNSGGGSLGDTATVEQLSGVAANIIDSGVTRYRPKLIIADHNVDAATANARAQCEYRQALAKAQRVECLVRGWYQSNGRLWQPNELTRVTAKPLGLNSEELLIVSVTWSMNGREGEVSRLTLALRDGYDLPAEPESGSGKNGSSGGSMVGMSQEEFDKLFPSSM